MDSADRIDTPEDDGAALKSRREALRGFVNDIADHVQTLSLPESYLEAERACRCVTIHDRVIQTLPLIAGDDLLAMQVKEGLPLPPFAPQMVPALDKRCTFDGAYPHEWGGRGEPLVEDFTGRAGMLPDAVLKPIRRHLRVYADRVMEATALLPKPTSFLEGERAGRYALACDRMLTQLYTMPKATPTAAPKAAAAKLSKRFRNPDGILMDRDEDYDGDEVDAAEAEELTDEQVDDWVEKIEARVHEEARAEAKADGFWTYDGEPFDPTDPDRERRGWDPVPEDLVLPECTSLDDWIEEMEVHTAQQKMKYRRRLGLDKTPAPLIETYLEAVDAEVEREALDESEFTHDVDDDEAELTGEESSDQSAETRPSSIFAPGGPGAVPLDAPYTGRISRPPGPGISRAPP